MPNPGPLQLDHSANAYITVFLSPASPFLANPSGLSTAHPSLSYIGQVGEMTDVQIVSLARTEWEKPDIKEDILTKLTNFQGVSDIEVVELPKIRAKRGEL